MAFLFLKCWYYSFLQQLLWILMRVSTKYWILRQYFDRLWLIFFSSLFIFIFWGSQKGPRPKLKASATQVWVATHSLKTSGVYSWSEGQFCWVLFWMTLPLTMEKICSMFLTFARVMSPCYPTSKHVRSQVKPFSKSEHNFHTWFFTSEHYHLSCQKTFLLFQCTQSQ